MDVTNLAFRRVPMANENSTNLFKIILSTFADAAEKLNPIVVGSSGHDNWGHIPLYLGTCMTGTCTVTLTLKSIETLQVIQVSIGTYSWGYRTEYPRYQDKRSSTCVSTTECDPSCRAH